MLGLRFCDRAFSSCREWGPLFIVVHGPLTIMASLVAEHRLQTRRLSSCGSWAQLLRGMWDPPRPGLEPVCPALADGFSTTAPPGKPKSCFCSTSLQAFGVVSVPNFAHYNWCTVGSYCCFNLQLSADIWWWAYFHMLICHLFLLWWGICWGFKSIF